MPLPHDQPLAFPSWAHELTAKVSDLLNQGEVKSFDWIYQVPPTELAGRMCFLSLNLVLDDAGFQTS